MKAWKLGLGVAVLMVTGAVQAAGQSASSWQFSVAPLVGGTLPLTVNGVKVVDASAPLSITIDGGQNKKALSLGGRVGVFRRMGDRFDLGLIGDVATFRYDGKAGIKTTVTGTVGRDRVNYTEVSTGDETRVIMSMASLVGRWRLGATSAMPDGRWLPYVGVGGGDQYANIRTAGFTTHAPTVRVVGGMEVPVNARFAIFGEYRYEHLWDEVSDGPSTTTLQLRTSHVAGGFTVRF